MDLNGVTAISKMNQVTLGGGIIEKETSTDINAPKIHSKVLLGDKFGQIHLLDVSRKLILDKLQIQSLSGRKIISISTASIEWIDTRLTYAAVVTRGSPFVHVICFKHNQNKMFHLYSLNTCPDLENPNQLELNPKQSYMELPATTKLSLDAHFLSVTSHDGRIRVFKMPPVFEPITNIVTS